MQSELEITINSRPLMLENLYGDVVPTTVWPGGSGELSWAVDATSRQGYHGGDVVRAFYGPVCVWGGTLNEPDPSADTLVAQGLWRLAEKFPALDGSNNATTIPDVAIDRAIALGLPWTRPATVFSSAVDLDTTQGPVSLAELLDAYTVQTAKRWGVTPLGVVFSKLDDTTPTWQTRALEDGLGYATDTYASTLVGRYLSGAGTYATSIRTAANLGLPDHGPAYTVVDLTPYGILTALKASNYLDKMLLLGLAVPQWTDAIDVSYGEILSPGGVPVDLETVAAGGLLRVQCGLDLAGRLDTAFFFDVPVGETSLADGVLTIKPLGLAARTLADVIAEQGNIAQLRKRS